MVGCFCILLIASYALRLWQFNLTGNQTEAEVLLSDMDQERDAALLAIKFGLAD